MKNEWYQCCYTNASHTIGDTLSTGWQQVSVSENTPSTVRKQCKKYQSVKSDIRHSMVDENGSILNLLEIIGDGAYLYMIRTQYGLNDAHGRANMFSHAYIFPCENGDIIREPNRFLTIANDNFTSDEQEAEKTKNGDTFIRLTDFSVEDILGRCGISDASYLILLFCVHAQLHSKGIDGPLYIECDGDDGRIRELLYLIYCGMPLSVRRRLSVLSCPLDDMRGRDLVFSKHAKGQKRYLVPQTGENNVLTEFDRRKFSRLGYAGYPAKICHRRDMQAYFIRLEGTAKGLGDSSAADETILCIAHKFCIQQKFSDIEKDELTRLLKAALRCRIAASPGMIQFIINLIKECADREYELTDTLKKLLSDYAEKNKDEELKKAAELYIGTSQEDAQEYDISIPETEKNEEVCEKVKPEDIEVTTEEYALENNRQQEIEIKNPPWRLSISCGTETIFCRSANHMGEFMHLLSRECMEELVQIFPELEIDKEVTAEKEPWWQKLLGRMRRGKKEMGSMADKKITCKCCGESYTAKIIKGWSQTTMSDLDTNPHNPMIYDRVTMCPHCGYATLHAMQETESQISELVYSEEYQNIFKDQNLDDTEKKLLLAGRLCKEQGAYHEAGMIYLMVYWYMQEHDEKAGNILEEVIECLSNYLEGQGDVDAAITLIDCLRQAGHFAEAEETAGSLMTYAKNERHLQIIRFELKLIACRDSSAHSQSEVIS